MRDLVFPNDHKSATIILCEFAYESKLLPHALSFVRPKNLFEKAQNNFPSLRKLL